MCFEIRFTWDPGNLALFGIYKLDGKLLIMLPGLIIDFPGKESSQNGKCPIIVEAEQCAMCSIAEITKAIYRTGHV